MLELEGEEGVAGQRKLTVAKLRTVIVLGPLTTVQEVTK